MREPGSKGSALMVPCIGAVGAACLWVVALDKQQREERGRKRERAAVAARETGARVLEAPSWVIRREGEQYGSTSDGGQGDHAVMGWFVRW